MAKGVLSRFAKSGMASNLFQAAAGAAGVFHGATLHLATAGPATITDRTVIADWTEVDVAVDEDYIDYAPVWTIVGVRPDGAWVVQAPDYVTKIVTDNLPDPIGIVGIYMVDEGGTHLLYSQYFDTAITLQFIGDSREIEVSIPINLLSIDMEPE